MGNAIILTKLIKLNGPFSAIISQDVFRYPKFAYNLTLKKICSSFYIMIHKCFSLTPF
jgi:hypothetical protein